MEGPLLMPSEERGMEKGRRQEEKGFSISEGNRMTQGEEVFAGGKGFVRHQVEKKAPRKKGGAFSPKAREQKKKKKKRGDPALQGEGKGIYPLPWVTGKRAGLDCVAAKRKKGEKGGGGGPLALAEKREKKKGGGTTLGRGAAKGGGK